MNTLSSWIGLIPISAQAWRDLGDVRTYSHPSATSDSKLSKSSTGIAIFDFPFLYNKGLEIREKSEFFEQISLELTRLGTREKTFWSAREFFRFVFIELINWRTERSHKLRFLRNGTKDSIICLKALKKSHPTLNTHKNSSIEKSQMSENFNFIKNLTFDPEMMTVQLITGGQL